MKQKNKKSKLLKNLIFLAVLATAFAAAAYLLRPQEHPPSLNQGTAQSSQQSVDSTPQPGALDKSLYSVDEPGSLWVVVNKGRRLSSNFTPSDLEIPNTLLRYTSGTEMQLRADAAKSVETMFEAASEDGQKLMVASGFRNYGLQSAIFTRHVNQLGVAAAEAVSARPGHSEHQTGWAVDIAPANGLCLIEECFGELTEGRWLAKNAHKYGFILRYKQSSSEKTGYSYEPWHFRFVGKALANELFSKNQTLEEFFNIPAYTTYPDKPTQL